MRTNGESKIFAAVLGIFGLGFMAWAGVLWDRSSVIIEQQTQILIQQGIYATRLNETERKISQHGGRYWHGQAGNALSELRARIDALENPNKR